ncbi:MAG: hypothetical protein VKK80_02020 [Prochlorothrix sp.]|nr:hypothetical protein [Prochlorothrix sp.]
MHFTLEPSTSGRGRAPVPTLLATPNRGNHGGIAPTKISSKWDAPILRRPDSPPRWRGHRDFSCCSLF